MRRREFITLVSGSAAAWPFVARAQEATKAYRIGFVGLPSAGSLPERLEAFSAPASVTSVIRRAGILSLSIGGQKDGTNVCPPFSRNWSG